MHWLGAPRPQTLIHREEDDVGFGPAKMMMVTSSPRTTPVYKPNGSRSVWQGFMWLRGNESRNSCGSIHEINIFTPRLRIYVFSICKFIKNSILK